MSIRAYAFIAFSIPFNGGFLGVQENPFRFGFCGSGIRPSIRHGFCGSDIVFVFVFCLFICSGLGHATMKATTKRVWKEADKITTDRGLLREHVLNTTSPNFQKQKHPN